MSFRTILVVEDSEALHPLLRRMLERPHRQVLIAADGPGALLLFEQHPGRIHLVIANVKLPGLGGAAVAEELRRRDPSLPILLLSGAFDDLEGGFPQLEKPFSASDLDARIDELLHEHGSARDGG